MGVNNDGYLCVIIERTDMAILKIYNEITTEEGKQINRWCMGTDGVCFKDIDEFVADVKTIIEAHK